jgi:hypothetical protein
VPDGRIVSSIVTSSQMHAVDVSLAIAGYDVYNSHVGIIREDVASLGRLAYS